MSKFAIDFDGVLWDGEKIREDIAEKIAQLREDGHKVYLWTARQGDLKRECMEIIEEAGIQFDELPEDYLKIGADYYIDDRAISIDEFMERERKMDRNRDVYQRRALISPTKFNTREDGEALYIEGYFAVFNSTYEIWNDATESIAPGAFTETLKDADVRALINHDTRLVLGRTKAETLELREDDHGLWGRVLINPNDQDAMNLYERVKRGDVDQCSFGFEIIREETEISDDGSIHWTIREVKLYEVSVCT
ncbi:MAG: HK97 family phage prohead protease, partial [Clostridia bacterium]|nr:HK97 family phage prohead protease [Clostridia bacterium]